METMKVSDLIYHLKGLDENLEVLLSKDAEGNAYLDIDEVDLTTCADIGLASVSVDSDKVVVIYPH